MSPVFLIAGSGFEFALRSRSVNRLFWHGLEGLFEYGATLANAVTVGVTYVEGGAEPRVGVAGGLGGVVFGEVPEHPNSYI